MATKTIRYVGGLEAVDVAGRTVTGGDTVDVAAAVADELVARGDFAAVKTPAKPNTKES